MAVPAECLPAPNFGRAAYAESVAHFERFLVGFVDSQEAHNMTHSDLERELEQRGRELMRKLLQEHIDSRSPGESVSPVRDKDGELRARVRLHQRGLETIFGRVRVERAGYGQEGLPSLHPMDAELNLPVESYSLELRRRVARAAAQCSFDDTVAYIDNNTAGHVPKRQSEELVQGAATDFDAFYETRSWNPASLEETGSILVMSVDGKGVVMRREDLREATRKAADESSHKMRSRLSPGEKKNAKRMATVAAVYTIEPHVRSPDDVVMRTMERKAAQKDARPKPECKRVFASLEKSPQQVIDDAFQEAFARDAHQQKSWVALVDGNKEQIKLLGRMAREKGVELTIILDIYHVLEYLWKAGRVFHPKSDTRLEVWIEDRFMQILEGKARYVASGIRGSATRQKISEKDRKGVDDCARYLCNNKDLVHYDRYLAAGFPIATGVIEGACRHLVKKRMEGSGARWSLAGAESVLKLRALGCSHDFDEYWVFHENKEYERNHQSRYFNGDVPNTISNRYTEKDAHLKIIKGTIKK